MAIYVVEEQKEGDEQEKKEGNKIPHACQSAETVSSYFCDKLKRTSRKAKHSI